MKRKTREMTKRLLSFFLAFVMVYTSSGMTVLAEGMEETVVESVASEDAVEVSEYSTEVASEVVDTSAENTQEEQKTSEEPTEEVQAQPTENVEDTSKETVEEASKEQTEAAGNVSAEPTEESGGYQQKEMTKPVKALMNQSKRHQKKKQKLRMK